MSEVTKILMIDENKKDMENILHAISQIPGDRYHLEWTPGYKEGLKKICSEKFDISLVDYHVGNDKGLSLIKKAMSSNCNMPVILMMDRENEKIDALALEAGVADYFIKGSYSPILLERSIRYSIAFFKNLQKIKSLNEELKKRISSREVVQPENNLGFPGKKSGIAVQVKNKTTHNGTKAQEKEEELNELKSRLVTMASHEFRTPLSTILSSASLIEQYAGMSGDLNNIIRHVHRIKFTVEELVGILNDLLLPEQMEKGKIENRKESFDLNLFTKEIINELKEGVKHGQKIVYYWSKKRNSRVLLDKSLLKNILLHLVSNSIKYSGEGTSIIITTKISAREIVVTVKDEGMGIPEKEQKHLFEKFFRASNALNIKGTGLGLNSIKNYLQLMGGDIEFESAVNKGSKFTLRFRSDTA